MRKAESGKRKAEGQKAYQGKSPLPPFAKGGNCCLRICSHLRVSRFLSPFRFPLSAFLLTSAFRLPPSAFLRNRVPFSIVTLLVVLLLAALTLAFSDETGVELTLSGTSRDSEQAYQTARSGVQAAMALMNADKDKEVDTLKEDWSQPEKITLSEDLMEGSSVAVRIADESGKLNLNTLVNSQRRGGGGAGTPGEETLPRSWTA